MIRSALVRVPFVAIGAAAAALVISWRAQTKPAPFAPGEPHSHVASGGALSSTGEGSRQADIEGRLKRLEAGLGKAAAEQHRLREQVATLAALVAARAGGAEQTKAAPAHTPVALSEAPANVAADGRITEAGTRSAMERALAAAGLDAATAAEIKRRRDESTMAEMSLRDQATREGWGDSPRFASEMAAIEAQRTPLRDEIGDDAYDRYLFALGQTNRIRVEDVLLQSPAAEAGLQAGDLIVSYAGDRLFAPNELVDATRSGTPGETVQVEIIRNGERFQVQVPRGPLGLRITAAQATPNAS